MKQTNSFYCRAWRFFAMALLLFVVSVAAKAYDFKVDGIYYNILSSSNKTCEVTYLYYYTSSNSEAYSGAVSIPETVTYEGTTYTVTSIGTQAFYYCTEVTSVTIPNSVTEIVWGAFNLCSGLTDIAIPNSVITIGNYAFYYCSGLTSVTIPNSVETIGSYAFESCSGLTSVTIGNSVTTIGIRAFADCSGLTSVTIGSRVATIGDSAFWGCSKLAGTLTIPNSVTTIGDYAFSRCTGLTQFEVAEGNKYYCSVDGVLYSKDMTTLIQFPASSSMTSYNIPESVTEMSGYAFYYCSGLTFVTIPNSVTEIRRYAFYNCTGLTEITIPNSVTNIGEQAFHSCTGLTNIIIGSTVKTIDNLAFGSCTGITSIYSLNPKPPTCSASGSGVFYNVPTSTCVLHVSVGSKESYSTANVWEDFKNIEEEDFLGDKFMVNGIYYKLSTGGAAVTSKFAGDDYPDYSEYVVIPEKVTYLGMTLDVTAVADEAFYNCTEVTSVTIPNSVTSIGDRAFYGCKKLKTLTMEDGEETLSIPTSSSYTPFTGCPIEILYLGRNVSYNSTYSPFRDNETLSSLTIGEKVTNIPSYLFYSCSGIDDELLIPNSVTSIGDYAFYQCNGITEAIIGSGEIGDYAFYDCTGLTSVGIGNGVTSIGDSAFYNCRTMRELTIGSRVATIGNSAFDSCRRLESLTSLNTTPPTCSASGNGVFYNVPVKTCTLYVTEGSLEAYSTADQWQDFLTIIDNQVDAIEDIMSNGNAEAVGYYTLDGKQVPTPQRGINIVRYSDGSAKKILMK